MTDDEMIDNAFNYDADSGQLTWRRPRSFRTPLGAVAGTPSKAGYLYVSVNYKRYLVHRIIWFMVTGAWPQNELDHKNGDKQDNRFDNLRPATRSNNACNRPTPAHNTSGVKGVSWSSKSGNWRTCIKIRRKYYDLGRYETLAEAGEVVALAREMLHETFAHNR